MAETYLEDLRKQSGLSIRQVLDTVRAVAPDICPIARSGIIHWEQQGILDIRVIQALQQVYSVPLEDVIRAAQASKARYLSTRSKPSRRHKNVSTKVTFSLDSV